MCLYVQLQSDCQRRMPCANRAAVETKMPKLRVEELRHASYGTVIKGSWRIRQGDSLLELIMSAREGRKSIEFCKRFCQPVFPASSFRLYLALRSL